MLHVPTIIHKDMHILSQGPKYLHNSQPLLCVQLWHLVNEAACAIHTWTQGMGHTCDLAWDSIARSLSACEGLL